MAATAPTDDIVLRMRGISKRFGPVQALSDVSIQVRRGTVHALCGENGAGKSTLMKILAGVYEPDQGTIELDGRLRRFAAPAEAIEVGISMIYQELDLAEDLTAAENIFLGAEPRGPIPFSIDRRALIAQTDSLAAGFGFSLEAGAKISGMSTGEC